MNSVGFAMSGTARLYFETAGSGAPLVFIHAGVADSRMWDPQFDKFALRNKVVRYDHRGFGKSTFPDEAFSLRDDLANVLQPAGVDKAVLVGCSMGGGTAIDFALEHPAMVSGLVLVGSGVSGLNDPKHLSDDTRRYWTELIGLVQKGEVERALEMDAKYWIDGPSRGASEVDPTYRERARQLHRENFSLERFKRQENTLTPPAIERLGEVAVPTMVVIGDHDSGDLKKLSDRFASEIPGSKLVRMNAAHLPSLEWPGEFNRLLEEFLGSITL
ncbi:MAG TPA: alpha/beta hydrolase [Candidatus Binataceae bacterium]|nr:alpha/beta hydrolase [Candidatus Binataceae bacterium]